MMTETPIVHELSAAEREGLTRVLARVARSADSIEQALDTLDHLADSGNLAALDGLLAEFNESFSAVTRPDLMGMVANAMMLMAVLSETSYTPLFNLAMRAPAALNADYARFQERTEPLGIREAFRLLRSPEVAAALELVVDVLRATRGAEGGTT